MFYMFYIFFYVLYVSIYMFYMAITYSVSSGACIFRQGVYEVTAKTMTLQI